MEDLFSILVPRVSPFYNDQFREKTFRTSIYLSLTSCFDFLWHKVPKTRVFREFMLKSSLRRFLSFFFNLKLCDISFRLFDQLYFKKPFLIHRLFILWSRLNARRCDEVDLPPKWVYNGAWTKLIND